MCKLTKFSFLVNNNHCSIQLAIWNPHVLNTAKRNRGVLWLIVIAYKRPNNLLHLLFVIYIAAPPKREQTQLLFLDPGWSRHSDPPPP